MATTEALLFGRRRDLGVGLVAGFAVAVALATVAALAAAVADHHTAAALSERTLPLLLLYAPAPIAAAGAYARCGGPACLAVGVVPAVVLGGLVVAGSAVGVPGAAGDVLVAGLTATHLVGSVTSAFIGFCAGVTAALVADLFGVGSDERDADPDRGVDPEQ